MSYRDSDAIQRNWIQFYIVFALGVCVVFVSLIMAVGRVNQADNTERNEVKLRCIEQGWSPERCK